LQPDPDVRRRGEVHMQVNTRKAGPVTILDVSGEIDFAVGCLENVHESRSRGGWTIHHARRCDLVVLVDLFFTALF
jgi:hypothetical protein